MEIPNPGVILLFFLNIFNITAQKGTTFSLEVQNIILNAMSVKKILKIYFFFDFLIQATQFVQFYPLKKMFFENFNTHCILTLINNDFVPGSLFFSLKLSEDI